MPDVNNVGVTGLLSSAVVPELPVAPVSGYAVGQTVEQHGMPDGPNSPTGGSSCHDGGTTSYELTDMDDTLSQLDAHALKKQILRLERKIRHNTIRDAILTCAQKLT